MKIVFIFIFALILAGCFNEKQLENNSNNAKPHIKISVLQSGKILIDGSESTIDQVKQGLVQLKSEDGLVWYYRETGLQEPPPEAIKVISLVIENNLPITLSSKSDFSDYIDENGRSHSR